MKKFSLILIAVYLAAGFLWLINGSWMINKLRLLDPTANLQYLYDLKNLLFLVVSIISIVLIINNRYSRLLLKEQILNRQLTAREQELEKVVRDYELVNKATNDVIWDYDIAKDELKWLHGYQELFGYEDGVTIRAKFWNMQKIHPDDRDEVIATFEKLLTGTHLRWAMEYRYLCKDEHYKYVSDRGYVIVNEQQEPVRMLGAMQDINKAKTYSQLLESQNRRLKEIAWLNSHETKRPLCNINGLIPLIKAGIDEPEELLTLIGLLETSANELDETINRINDFSQ